MVVFINGITVEGNETPLEHSAIIVFGSYAIISERIR